MSDEKTTWKRTDGYPVRYSATIDGTDYEVRKYESGGRWNAVVWRVYVAGAIGRSAERITETNTFADAKRQCAIDAAKRAAAPKVQP